MAQTLTRRAVLAGAVGAGLTGACGRDGREERSETFRTRQWPGRDVRWRLVMPAGGEVTGVVIVLHGKGGNADAAFDQVRLGDHVRDTRLAIASVDGGDYYWHRRRSGVDTGAMVREDFLPLVAREVGYAEKVTLLGWSMGGYGALLLAGELGPERVGAVVAESAALWTDASLSPAGAFDDREDFEAHDVFDRQDALRDIPIRLDCGDQDPFAAANRALAERIPWARLTIDGGAHTQAYWRSHAAAQLAWVRAQLRSPR